MPRDPKSMFREIPDWKSPSSDFPSIREAIDKYLKPQLQQRKRPEKSPKKKVASK
jgi:hypothetical protein